MQFLYGSWLRLSLATRVKIATAFGISKTGPTHVQDNVVVSDGYNIHTIEEVLNVDALQKYLNSTETDMQILFQKLVDITEGRAPNVVIEPDVPSPENRTVTPQKRGRAPKKA